MTDDDTFPQGWKSAAVTPPARGWYERIYSDGTYVHHWSGEQWSATKGGPAHWRQLADAPYPLWRLIPDTPGVATCDICKGSGCFACGQEHPAYGVPGCVKEGS